LGLRKGSYHAINGMGGRNATNALGSLGWAFIARSLASRRSDCGCFARTLQDNGFSVSWAELAGRWHDLGKYRPGFQRYVRQTEDAHIERRVAGREKPIPLPGRCGPCGS
jgi:hypothetical protein